jgi:hypothetical protein
MTVYITPFLADTLECTAPSEPAGFDTLDDVRELMGPPNNQHDALLVYGEGNDRILFSRLVWKSE